MPITGHFEADFDQFYNAVEGANLRLKSLTDGGASVERQLSRVADSLSGRKLISDATIMSEAVDRLGGVSKLTGAELARLGPQAEAAVEKMRALGRTDIPDNLQRIAEASRSTGSGMSEAAKAIADTDNVLDLFGVNLGPARRALDDLGAAAGKTAGQIGLIGSASLVAGAALGGWEIGRKISELGGLDKKIGDLTAKLLGWGDVAGQEAAAGADTLARASEHAGRAITDMGEALRINADWAAQATTENKKFAEQADRGVASGKNAEAIKAFNDELAAFRKSGYLDDLTRDLRSNLFTQKDLADAYKISQAAVSAFAKESADAARIEESNAKKLADVRDQMTKGIAEQEAKKQEALKQTIAVMYEEIDAAYKSAEAAKAKRDAENDAAIAAAANAKAAAERARAESIAAEDKARQDRYSQVVGSIDIGSVSGAQAFLAGPAKTLDDFIHLYESPQIIAPLEWRAKQYEQYKAARETARQTLIEAGMTQYMTPEERRARELAGGAAQTPLERYREQFKQQQAGAAPAVTVNVSGMLDPRTIGELSTAVAGAFVKRSGAKVGFY